MKPPSTRHTQRESSSDLVKKLEEKNRQLEEIKAKLEYSESRLKEAQSIAHIGNWEVDLIKGTQSWSDEVYTIFGIRKGEVTPSVEAFLRFIHPEEREQVTKLVEETFDTGKNGSFDFRFIRNDSQLRYAYCEWRIVFENEKPVRIYGITWDTTEVRVTQEKLHRSEERLGLLVERMSDGFIHLDRDFKYLYANKKICELIGRDMISLVGKSVWDIFPDAVGSSTYEAFNQALVEQKYVCNSDYYAPLDLWQENHIYPSSKGLYVLIRDISAQKKTEKRLIENEQRFRTLIDNISDAIVLSDEQSGILYQSPSVAKILGYTAEERTGRRVADDLHPDDYPAFTELYEQLNSNPGKPMPLQYRLRHKDGHYIWLEGVITNLMHDPSIGAYLANYRDVSHRKNVEENLELVLNRFKQAQQTAHLGHWEIDFRTGKAAWSDEAYRIYGMEPGEAEAGEQLFIDHVHPEDRERVQRIMDEGKRTFSSGSFYHRILRKDGSVRNILAVSKYEFDKSGKPIGLYGICLDVTELIQKENELAQANKELETFIYKASHDLQSPITSILGLVNIARIELSDPVALEFINKIGDITRKQNKMLVNLTRIMSVRDRVPVPEAFEFKTMIGDVLDSMKSLDGFERIRFNVTDGLNGLVYTDKNMLKDILHQLLKNSVVYMNPAQEQPSVTISAKKDSKNMLVIEVEDNGQGIIERAQPRIFEMFYRGSSLSKGSGLGLYFAKKASESLGGNLELVHTDTRGSKFRVRIPAKSAGIAAMSPDPQSKVRINFIL